MISLNQMQEAQQARAGRRQGRRSGGERCAARPRRGVLPAGAAPHPGEIRAERLVRRCVAYGK